MTQAKVDPHLIKAWTKGWAVTRGVVAPAPDHGGWRVDVGWPDQRRRYVFAALSEEITALARTVHEPFVFIKACAAPQDLAALLPEPWEIQRLGWFMGVDPEWRGQAAAACAGYELLLTERAGVHTAALHTQAGETAASGRLAVHDGFAVYNDIATDASHRRRGLGRTIMLALAAKAKALGAHADLLVATSEGRGLYTSLGWRVLSDYATAAIPAKTFSTPPG